MNKMTASEKVEVINAFYEGKGKRVQVFDRASDSWKDVALQIWDFEHNQYRIKPTKETTKFKVGDVLVFKKVAGELNPFRYEITEITEDSYKFKHISPSSIEEVDKNFINERDVLWYFELYDYYNKEYSLSSSRHTMGEANRDFSPYHDTFKWTPMYNLGFKLKEN